MTALYQKHHCKDCGEPWWWDDNIRSPKTGNRIPLNSDGTKHFTTCAAKPPQQQQQQQQQQAIPISGPKADDWETRLGLLNSQIFMRLDRIDKSIMEIARAMEGVAQYYKQNQEAADAEAAYDNDKEAGLV